VVLAAIVVVVAWPGAFPVWLRVEQAVCGVFLLSVVVRTNLPSVRRAVAAGREQPAAGPLTRR